MKSRLFLFTLLFFASTQLLSSDRTDTADCKNCKSNFFQKAWKHKKKTIAAIGIVVTAFWILKTQRKWYLLCNNFNLARNGRLSSSDDRKKAADALADFTIKSYFISSDQKQFVARLIDGCHDCFFPNWKVVQVGDKLRITGSK